MTTREILRDGISSTMSAADTEVTVARGSKSEEVENIFSAEIFSPLKYFSGWRPRGGGFGRGGARGRPMYGGDFRGDRGYSPERGGGRRHEMSPPPKRMRGGWGGDDDRYGGRMTC